MTDDTERNPTDAAFEAVLNEYRPINWAPKQFEAATHQAADNTTNGHPIYSDEWLAEFACHLGDIVEGRIPNDYWEGWK